MFCFVVTLQSPVFLIRHSMTSLLPAAHSATVSKTPSSSPEVKTAARPRRTRRLERPSRTRRTEEEEDVSEVPTLEKHVKRHKKVRENKFT